MKRSWNTLSQQSNGAWSAQDFERAAYRLVTEQVLSAGDRGTRLAYHLVEEHFEDFVAALAPLGVRLERNAHYRYVVALPTHGEGAPVSLAETLLLLVLRQRYDVAMREGLIEDDGLVTVELPDLQEAYPQLTGRPMPDVGLLRELARTLRRWGVCRLVEVDGDDPQPFHLQVRPAIVEIIGEQWLQRLDQHYRGGDEDDAPDTAAFAGDDDAKA
ncbi:DUF4194 domain-containing protein [Pseudofulvimonas gallinarii]|uniref:Uncharacterized protein DUF4194 n=1 Tax=Pseudofulvimonas gallinarii TaxID=634155 RepID=A0A4S3KY80_9GAMM|nr:DUF4194 domain-containing protein [Pseudofulvimonas gallinarii]TCS98863.1 uncharacterized protein DUF4194 [Pseudofulvimonas gallinarii]THD14345.1 hypothetical protein B1808_03530 [Pseudofulvimonas gallinarii]